MAWVVLVLSGVLEAVWAVALGKSEGFTRLAASLVFLVGLLLSMVGLAYALRTIPIGTGYAIWVGIGAALTVAYGMASGAESVTALRCCCSSVLSDALSASSWSTDPVRSSA